MQDFLFGGGHCLPVFPAGSKQLKWFQTISMWFSLISGIVYSQTHHIMHRKVLKRGYGIMQKAT